MSSNTRNEDIKTMKAIRKILDNNEDVEVRKDKDGKIKIIASKKRRVCVE